MSFDLSTIQIETILPIIREVADRYLTREDSQNIIVKGDSNFVTRVDTNIENAMKSRLAALYPEIQFMGEESDNRHLDFSMLVSTRVTKLESPFTIMFWESSRVR